MNLYTPQVPGRYVQLLLDYLGQADTPWLPRALAAAGIEAAALEDADAVCSMAQFDVLLTAVAEMGGLADIGFELGRRIHIGLHAGFSARARGCATLDELLRLASRQYRSITTCFWLQYRREASSGELMFWPAAGMSPLTLRMFFEIHAASMFGNLSSVLGARLTPFDCYLPFAAPAHAARYCALAPLRFHFHPAPLPVLRVVLPATLLAAPLAPGPSLACQGSARPSAAARSPHWADWTRLMLREADGCQPTQAELAALLHVSAHTLARHLAHEGTSFRVLANAVRFERACSLLRGAAMPVSDIALQLGYSDLAAFSNAFRAAAGVSPRSYRAACSAQAAPLSISTRCRVLPGTRRAAGPAPESAREIGR